MTDKSNIYSVLIFVALFLSVLLVTSALGVLVWALGWGVLAVLGGAFVIFVVFSVVRDTLADMCSRD